MRTNRAAWPLAGLVAGAAGLATSFFVAMAMSIRESPVVAVSELVIRLTPGPAAERAIRLVGHKDKPALVVGVVVATALLFAFAGWLAARTRWAPVVFLGLAAVGAVAVAVQRGAGPFDAAPVLVGLATWLVCLPLLTAPLRAAAAHEPGDETEEPGGAPADRVGCGNTRRTFLVRTGVVAGAAIVVGYLGHVVGRGRRHVEQSRRLLRLQGVTPPRVPDRARVGLRGIAPWMTPADDFYQIHTAIVVPAIEPVDWRLRIHGMVDHEIVLTYEELLARQITEGWITLNCVSNPVGGPLIGNAWWSGVRLADLLAEAGVKGGADAVKQTSDDGWTCGTPLRMLTDDRNAMLAVAMNGKPLPLEHGFPVRTIVPGLYGYVSACKWVVDMEVTRFDRFDAYWTDRGWSETGPVKLSSRIDVPRSGAEVAAGQVGIGGVAWAQHIGIEAVEVAVDGGDWRPADLASAPTDDAWTQWTATIDVEPGDHLVRVRATDRHGLVQTGVERDVLPDGSTGWHTVAFTATET